MRVVLKGRAVTAALLSLAAILVAAVGATSASAAEITHPSVGQITGCAPSSFTQPWGLSFNSSGDLFVADAGAENISEFSPSNACLTQFTGKFEGLGYTRSVAVNDTTGTVYVASAGTEAVHVFKPEGGTYKEIQKLVTPVGNYMYVTVDNSPGEFKGDVFVGEGEITINRFVPNAEGELSNSSRKEIVPPAGGFGLVSEFAVGVEAGSGGNYVDPATGKLYVSEPGPPGEGHDLVSVYNAKDVLEKQFSGSGTPAGSFEPIGVGVDDSNGDIYVVDGLHKVVDEFSSTGTYLTQITGVSGTEPFKTPLAVAVQNAAGPTQGDIYVSDSGKVDIFEAYSAPKFTLTVEKTGTGSGTVASAPSGISCGAECSHGFEEGAKVTLNETPGSGSTFTGWTGCDTETAGECEVTLSAAKNVKAQFTFTPPANTVLPVVEGVEKEGHTLTTTNGTWTGSPTGYTYQWEDCNTLGEACASILDATSSSYTLTKDDVGSTVRAVVTAKNAGGPTSASSAATGVIAALAGEASVSSNVYGEVEQAVTLGSTCSNVNLGPFLPLATNAFYEKTCTLTATSTLAESALTAEDSSATDKGHLVNGTYFLTDPLETKATETEGVSTGGGSFAALTSPVTLLSYPTPVTANAVTVAFKQEIPGHEGLRTGTYAKTITITLAAKTP